MLKKVSVCLLSGGIDSSVAAFTCDPADNEIYLLSLNYGQVMRRELDSARAIGASVAARDHKFVEILHFDEISSSARTCEPLIERNREGTLASGNVPSAYPPGRDFTFISLAAAWAETLVLASPERYGDARIVIGTNKTDSLDYPDCQSHVYVAFTNLLRNSLKMCKVMGREISVEAPLITRTKQEVIALGNELGVPLNLTWSCYYGGVKACGVCDACRIRYWAFKSCGLSDPLKYEVAEVAPLHAPDSVPA